MQGGEYYLKQLKTKQSDKKIDYDLNIYDLDGRNKNQVFENRHTENLKQLENNFALNNLKLDNKLEKNLEKIKLAKEKGELNLVQKEGKINKLLENKIHENNKEKQKIENEHFENLKKKEIEYNKEKNDMEINKLKIDMSIKDNIQKDYFDFQEKKIKMKNDFDEKIQNLLNQNELDDFKNDMEYEKKLMALQEEKLEQDYMIQMMMQNMMNNQFNPMVMNQLNSQNK